MTKMTRLATRIIFLACFVYFMVICPKSVSGQIKKIHLMGGIPITGTLWPGGRGVLQATYMAIRDINARDDVLQDYELHFHWRDSQCEVGVGINVLYEMLYTPPTKHMIIGPACSPEASILAEASHTWNISHFTYAATSPELSDKQRFPRFFRIFPPDTRFNLARVALFEHFNWTKIAVLTHSIDFFLAVADDLFEKLKAKNMSLITEEVFHTDPYQKVQNLKSKDARIIVVGAYPDTARLILCAAYRVNLYGPKIVWMFPGWYPNSWWRIELDGVPCNLQQMNIAAEGHILTAQYFYNPVEEKGIGGMTSTEFNERFLNEPTYTNATIQYDFITASVYDSVWGSALALNCTDMEMKARGYNKSLDEFEYTDGDIGDIMTSCIYNVSFLGLTGRIRFDRSGEPRKNIKMVQVRESEKVTVGRYVLEDNDRRFQWYGKGIAWKGDVVPRDSTVVTQLENTISLALYASLSGCALLGILLAVFLLTFNIVYRDHTYVKMSSPSINNIILLGCVLTYGTVFLYSYDEKTSLLCKLRHAMLTIGFTTSFGAMLSKTWRVYKIFCNRKMQRVNIQDFHLAGLVVLLLGVMCATLVAWEIIDPLYILKIERRQETYNIGNDAIVVPYIRQCTSEYYYYFLGAMCLVEGLLMAFGAFLAFETRKVKIEGLNDSREVGLCLYNVVILSTFLLVLSIIVDDNVSVNYAVYSGFIIVGTTSVQLIMFLPKMQGGRVLHLYNGPLNNDSLLTTTLATLVRTTVIQIRVFVVFGKQKSKGDAKAISARPTSSAEPEAFDRTKSYVYTG